MDCRYGTFDTAGDSIFDPFATQVDRPDPSIANFAFVLQQTGKEPHHESIDRNGLLAMQMSLWTAGVVVLTLLVNAPLIPLLLKWTGLTEVSPVKAKIRAKAARAFTRYTQNAVTELKNDEDEMLRGNIFENKHLPCANRFSQESFAHSWPSWAFLAFL